MAAAKTQWMDMPRLGDDAHSCPPGLEYLASVEQIIVHQQVELLEAFVGFETQNKYAVKNSMGQQIYFAAEESACLERQCCGNMRSFQIKVIDHAQREVMRLSKPLHLSCCRCFPIEFCQDVVEVQAPPGTTIGYVRSRAFCFTPVFDILDQAMQPTGLVIKGPCCGGCCIPKFQVMSDGTEVGVIQKQWSGLAKELFTDADNFGVTFPLDMSVAMKATLLGACFLVDFVFFENNAGAGVRGDAAGDAVCLTILCACMQ